MLFIIIYYIFQCYICGMCGLLNWFWFFFFWNGFDCLISFWGKELCCFGGFDWDGACNLCLASLFIYCSVVYVRFMAWVSDHKKDFYFWFYLKWFCAICLGKIIVCLVLFILTRTYIIIYWFLFLWRNWRCFFLHLCFWFRYSILYLLKITCFCHSQVESHMRNVIINLHAIFSFVSFLLTLRIPFINYVHHNCEAGNCGS